MAIVIIETPTLSAEQKSRVGERIITALQHEGITPGSVVVLFQPERGDIYLDGLLIQSQASATAVVVPAPRIASPEAAQEAAPAYKIGRASCRERV